MIPILFDTNIYGKIVTDAEGDEVVARIATSRFKVLNFALIRNELRNTAKGKTYGGGTKLRPALLTLHDRIVGGQNQIPLSREIKRLADEYYRRYRELGGNLAKKRILNDLRILACASLRGCYTIASDDSHFFRSSRLVEACVTVNPKYQLRLPGVTTYRGLKSILNVP